LGAGKKIVGVVLVLLMVTSPVLLGTGVILASYWAPEGPNPTPTGWSYRNVSIPASGTLEYRDTIKYINSPPEVFINKYDGFYMEILTPKNEVTIRDLLYLYVGVSYPGSSNLGINYTVYGPTGDLIYAKVVDGSSSGSPLSMPDRTILFNLYSIVDANAEGNYTFRIANIGQYAVNATIMLGDGGIRQIRPFFYVGLVLVALGAVDLVGLLALTWRRDRKTD
jgi:hypothetical protein